VQAFREFIVVSDTFSVSMPAYPVILSGGSGTRLWPLSRHDRPKQFIPLVSDLSLMQDSVLRTRGVQDFLSPIIVANERHETLVEEQLEHLKVVPSALILEPVGRNTAAAIAIAAQWIVKQHEDGLMLVMPSDHVIADLDSFHRVVEAARPAAMDGYLVTFGITPSHPETGFGYIEMGEPLPGGALHAVLDFHEKPPKALAEEYLASGRHFWNGGIFLFRATQILAALKRDAPDVLESCARAMDGADIQGTTWRPELPAFESCPDVSIDYAVMEKADRVAVIPTSIGWSDVGSWDALWAIRERDDLENSSKGPVINIDCRGNLFYVDGGPPIASIGLENCIVVSTAEGVLVIPRDRAQDIKKVVELLNAGRLQH
jgi:mannose-1-phosphate guanylyltransferase/mannose-6-phosphate isomerase